METMGQFDYGYILIDDILRIFIGEKCISRLDFKNGEWVGVGYEIYSNKSVEEVVNSELFRLRYF